MKKNQITALLLAAMMLTGCGAAQTNEATDDMQQEIAEQTDMETEAAEETTEEAAETTVPEAEETTEPESTETEQLPETIPDEAFEPVVNDSDFSAAQMDFAVNLLKAVQQEKKAENVMISPYSVGMVLGMTANGAAGSTLDELQRVLGHGMERDALIASYKEWAAHQPDTANCSLKTANAIWFKEEDDFAVYPEFLQACEEKFGSEAYQDPFNQETITKINNWVNLHTDRMIPKIIDKLDQDDLMVLVNAVCFDAKWKAPYEGEDLKQKIFKNADGTEKETEFMHSNETVYLQQDGARGFMKDYDGDCAFVGILPPEGVSAQQYLNDLTGEKLQQMLASRKAQEVSAFLPSFKYDTDSSLEASLKALGLPAAFSDEADFSGISATPLKINKVLHKTHIEVDSKGTKAAAATVGTFARVTSVMQPKEIPIVRLDRPFVYMILDTQNDLPLFIGTVNQL